MTAVAKTDEKSQTPAIADKKEMSHSERFTNMVIKEFTSNAGDLSITNFQRKLCQNYFIKLDATLKENEQKRMAKSEQYREAIAFTWENVNMQKLSQDVISFSSIGMDPCQKNHINLICYANNKTGKYDIGFIIGYVGLELKAKKYGYEVPDDVIIEVVHKNDKFVPIKKDKNNPVETYEYEQTNAFDRGDVVGGFYYHNYFNSPQKSKLRTFSLEDIERRRPEKASAEFWGGQKDEYKDGKKTGKKITVEGWFEEMVYKTIARAAYDAIAIDSQKIDENFLKTVEAENEYYKLDSPEEGKKNQISQRANAKPLTFEEPKTEDAIYTEVKESAIPPVDGAKPEDSQQGDQQLPAENKTDIQAFESMIPEGSPSSGALAAELDKKANEEVNPKQGDLKF